MIRLTTTLLLSLTLAITAAAQNPSWYGGYPHWSNGDMISLWEEIGEGTPGNSEQSYIDELEADSNLHWPASAEPDNWLGYGGQYDIDTCIENAWNTAIYWENLPDYAEVPLHPDDDPYFQALNAPFLDPLYQPRLDEIAATEAYNDALFQSWLTSDQYAVPSWLQQSIAVLRDKARDALDHHIRQRRRHQHEMAMIKWKALTANGGTTDFDPYEIDFYEPTATEKEAFLYLWFLDRFELFKQTMQANEALQWMLNEIANGRPVPGPIEDIAQPPHSSVKKGDGGGGN